MVDPSMVLDQGLGLPLGLQEMVKMGGSSMEAVVEEEEAVVVDKMVGLDVDLDLPWAQAQPRLVQILSVDLLVLVVMVAVEAVDKLEATMDLVVMGMVAALALAPVSLTMGTGPVVLMQMLMLLAMVEGEAMVKMVEVVGVKVEEVETAMDTRKIFFINHYLKMEPNPV